MWRTSFPSRLSRVSVFCLSTLGIYLLGCFFLSFQGQGQQPNTIPPNAIPSQPFPMEQPPVRRDDSTNEPVHVPLSLDPPPAIGVDLSRDPIFQELKRAFLSKDSHSNSHSTGESHAGIVNQEISDSTWQAVEHLLASASALQSDQARFAQNNDTANLERTKKAIHTIRELVRSLLK